MNAGAGRGDQSLRGREGRVLCFRECGAADGDPLFYFHGWPGSRLDCGILDGAAAVAGVRVIAVDRPGMGGSDRQRGRRVLDWPADVALLADSLGLDRFAVLGFSFGGAYARACAYALPRRVTRALLVSSVGPLDEPAPGRVLLRRSLRVTLELARRSPTLVLPLVWRDARAVRADAPSETSPAWMPAADAAVLARAEVAACLRASAAECYRRGLRGTADDAAAIARGEGFRVEDIEADVLIWHGEEDRSEPVAMAREQERRIANVNARYVEGGGHLIMFSHTEEILAGVRG